jgi:hypothetical protein
MTGDSGFAAVAAPRNDEKRPVSLRAKGSRERAPDDRLREAIQSLFASRNWIASAYAQGRFGGLQARHSSRSERRRVVAYAPRNDSRAKHTLLRQARALAAHPRLSSVVSIGST